MRQLDSENTIEEVERRVYQDFSVHLSLAEQYLAWSIKTGKFIPNYSQIEMEAVMRERKRTGFTSYKEEEKIRKHASEDRTILNDLTEYEQAKRYPELLSRLREIRDAYTLL